MPVKTPVQEILIEMELTKRVLAAGGVCEKVTAARSRGYFDRVVVMPGNVVIFVECKRPRGGRLSPHQKRRHATYRALGATVAIVKNSEDIDRLLSQSDKKKAGCLHSATAF
jgi:hypothetical protein